MMKPDYRVQATICEIDEKDRSQFNDNTHFILLSVYVPGDSRYFEYEEFRCEIDARNACFRKWAVDEVRFVHFRNGEILVAVKEGNNG